jgi:exosortase/archaeosortase family protein
MLALTEGLAYSARAALQALGATTAVQFDPQPGPHLEGYALVGERMSLRIANDCNGGWAFAIFLAAALAVPSSWRAKAWAVGLGLPALWGVNVVRVVTLYYLAIYFPNLFEALHLYVWQFLIIGAGLLLLVMWAEVFVAAEHA